MTLPEWVPIDKHSSTVITVPEPNDWIDVIGVPEVMAALAPHAPAVAPDPR